MPLDRALVVTAAADPWRRALPPSAWLVLEELAIGASDDGVLSTNVRRLGASLGLSKDTVARALRVLIRAGLVERVDERDARSGRFGAVVYRVDRDAAGLTVTDRQPTLSAVAGLEFEPRAVPNESRPSATRSRLLRPTRPAASASSIGQLNLFEGRS
jgi:DNA-binding transcriptional ArsR family regulator